MQILGNKNITSPTCASRQRTLNGNNDDNLIFVACVVRKFHVSFSGGI